jgi:hypothetical protein
VSETRAPYDVTAHESTVEELSAELEAIGGLIEEAAAEGRVGDALKLMVRERALPALIRRAKAAPLLEEISRLEGEMRGIVEEQQRVLDAPLPEQTFEQASRGITPEVLRQGELLGLSARQQEVREALRSLRGRLREVEGA